MSQDNNLNARTILAKNVKELRLKNNLKCEELSLALGFDNSYISKIENKRINISLDKIELIAKHFNVNISFLFKT